MGVAVKKKISRGETIFNFKKCNLIQKDKQRNVRY